MTSIVLAGYLSTLHVCHDFNCKLLKTFKKQSCVVQFDGETAQAFGVSYDMKQVIYGRSDGFEGKNLNYNLTVFFKPKFKPLRTYVSVYSDAHNYKKWTCEYGREKEKEW